MKKEKNKLKPIDAPVYSYWSALYMCFYSRRLYVDVGKRWNGLGILYLLLVIAIVSIPFFVRTTYSLNNAFREQITEPLTKIPTFYIQGGEVSFDRPMPYLIKNSKGQVLVAIDTTGKITDFTDEYPELTILITKSQIAFRIPRLQLFNMENEPRPDRGAPFVQPFDKETNLVFNGKQIAEENSITKLRLFSEVIIYPMIVAIFFSIFIIFFLVFGFLGQVFSTTFFSFKVPFTTSIRLLTVAGTPMLLFLLIMLTLNYIFKGSGIILFLLLYGYYSLALYSLKAESRQIVKQ